MSTIIGGLFDSLNDAQAAVDELTFRGYKQDLITLLTNKNGSVHPVPEAVLVGATEDAVTAGDGAAFGALVGAATGILATLGAFVIPGFGPVLAAGPIVAALTGGAVGVVAGAATGGIVGALVKTGVPEEEAEYFVEGVKKGGALVMVETAEGDEGTALDTLRNHYAHGVTQRSERQVETIYPPHTEQSKEMIDRPASNQAPPVANMPDTLEAAAQPTSGTPSVLPQAAVLPVDTFEAYEADYRKHFAATYPDRVGDYNIFKPFYELGYDLAHSPSYRSAAWQEVEPEARVSWAHSYSLYPWEAYRDAVQFGWDRVRRNR